jgi:demethylmenaquinone methyltransferase / 2-methoxy-6-polyprenyl-1,4-benzoquinol methylase
VPFLDLRLKRVLQFGEESEIKLTANEATLAKPLHGMFSDVPPRYDLINGVITWNMDKLWRNLAARACLSSQPEHFLDLCCGTGDLALAVSRLSARPVEIHGLDFSQPMLERASKKAARLGPGNSIHFVQGEAAKLPYSDGYFDCLGISFAFRNLTYKNPLVREHLAEMARVLKPGGRCVIAESSQPESKLVRSLYHIYMRRFVSTAGRLLSGNKKAYTYLAESASRFYNPTELRHLLLGSGFRAVSYQPLLFGAAGIHVAVK